jgi:prepilin-type N-terminal cleavage/methylation domain-containing protein
MPKGFTLIELLIVVVIVVILGSIIVGATGLFNNRTFEAEVVDKYTDLDGDNNRCYRCRTISNSGDVETWNSYWCHNDIQVGVSYEFQTRGNWLIKANKLLVQPQRVRNE